MRTAVKDRTVLGEKARQYINAGQLVPDDLMIEIVRERISQDDCKSGFILDGFPRTIPQAKKLEEIVPLDMVIFFDVPEEECIRRLTSRRICPRCGLIYNPATHPPLRPGRCDKCGGPLVAREDDKPEVIRERLKVYRAQTQPVIEFYKNLGKLVTMNKVGSPDEVFEYLVSLVMEHEHSGTHH